MQAIYAAKGGTVFSNEGPPTGWVAATRSRGGNSSAVDQLCIPLSDLLEFAAHLRAGPLCTGCGAPADTLRHGKCIECWARGQEWVKVHDRLPSLDEQVLCYSPFVYAYRDKELNVYRVTYQLSAEFARVSNITHWMPLPPQPAAEGGEEKK